MAQMKTALAQQSLTLVSVFVNTFMYGCANSWISNAIIFLTKPGHIPSATVEQCGLMAQFFETGRLTFAIPGGLLVDRYGRKKILISIGTLNFVAWVTICFTDSLLLIYIARFCLGIAVALLYVSAYSTIGEIASPEYRGTLTSINELANMFGQLFESVVMVIGKTYFALTALTALTAASFFPTIWWLIESPHYLANVADFERAKKNLKTIRPDSSEREVNAEFETLVESVARQKNQIKASWMNFYKVKAFREPLRCVLLLNVVAVTCGGPVMALYVAVMLPENPYFANDYYALISFAIQFVAALGSTFIMDRFPRRRLFLAAALVSLAMQSSNALAYAMYSGGGGEFWKWLFILNNFLYMFVDRGLISPCNCTVRSEIFPYTLKGIGNALCVIAQAISMIVSYQIYDFVKPKFGLPANFIIFAFDSALLAAIIYRFLPEMAGRSLTEVQDNMADEFREYEAIISET